MTHRVHPYIFRIGHVTNWKSRWFSMKQYAEFLRDDTLLRAWLHKKLVKSFVSDIDIERSPNTLHIIIRTSRPGFIIGRGGEGSTKLKTEIQKQLMTIWKRSGWKKTYPEKREIKLTIEEIKTPSMDAATVAQGIAEDLEKRLPFRRVMKQAIEKVSANKEAKGVKIALSGRLDGSEMARFEWAKEGRIPLQTLRAHINYAQREALCTYGIIGVKVWIYKGEVFADKSAK
ncbi:MAG: 30S ribosomal protein S3 [bacterium]|nr:30S ribosomal protein S3 [bacterium]